MRYSLRTFISEKASPLSRFVRPVTPDITYSLWNLCILFFLKNAQLLFLFLFRHWRAKTFRFTTFCSLRAFPANLVTILTYWEEWQIEFLNEIVYKSPFTVIENACWDVIFGIIFSNIILKYHCSMLFIWVLRWKTIVRKEVWWKQD